MAMKLHAFSCEVPTDVSRF